MTGSCQSPKMHCDDTVMHTVCFTLVNTQFSTATVAATAANADTTVAAVPTTTTNWTS